MRALWLLLATALVCCRPAGVPDAECVACLRERTIEGLIGLGADPGGWWYQNGRSLPVDVLDERPRADVLAALRKALGDAASAGEYHDAFVVHALRGLRVKNLAAELLRAYPRLDAAGRYEVLLYGVEYELESYAPLFVDVLERSAPGAIERRDLLAVVYARRVPSQSALLPGLRRLARRIAESGVGERSARAADSDCQDFTDLDGFPYRGLALLGVCDSAESVRFAISRIERYRPVGPMNAEEQALLARARDALLDPVRRPIAIEDLPVVDAFQELWRVFGTEPDPGTPATLRAVADRMLAQRVTFRSEAASQSDVAAAICSQTGVWITPGFGAAMPPETPLYNSCVARRGMVFQVRIYEGNPALLRGFVGSSGPLRWHPLAPHGFELEAARLPGGVDIGKQSELGQRYAFFSLAEEAWREAGHLEELRGAVMQPIPTALRRSVVEPEPGRTVTRELEDYRRISVQCEQAPDGSWDLEIRIGRELDDLALPVNPHAEIGLELPDETGGHVPRRSGATTRSRAGYTQVPPGSRVVWTWASGREVLPVPVVWTSLDRAAPP